MLSTPRLLFRQFTAADLNLLYQEIYSQPAVAQALSPTGTVSLPQVADLLQRRLQHWQHGFGCWALIYRSNQHLIGHCGLQYLADTAEVELTYTLNPTYWRQGLATEAAEAVLAWGFNDLGLRQIVAVTGPDNLASQRVMQKLGLRYQKNICYNSTEVVYYAIARHDFDLNKFHASHESG